MIDISTIIDAMKTGPIFAFLGLSILVPILILGKVISSLPGEIIFGAGLG